MPSTNLSTTSYGDAQRLGKVLVAAGANASAAGLWKLQCRNSSGTITTYNVWISSDGRLRYSTTEPTNQLTSGTDIVSTLPAGSVATADLADLAVTTAKLAADAVNGSKIADDSVDSEHYVDGSIDTAHLADSQVTPLKSSTAMQEMPIAYRVEDLSAGSDISGRTIFRTTSTMSLNSGSAYVSFRDAVSVGSGDTLSLGLGTSAAFNLFGRSWTSTVSAGTFTSIAAGSVTAISTSTNVRLDVTQSAGVNAGNLDIVWIPRKRGSN